MRNSKPLSWVAAQLLMTTAVVVPASAVMAKPAATVEGSWKGSFLGSEFTFEFTRSGDAWTGRYWSQKSGKWAGLEDVTVVGDTVRFTFTSQPPSAFELRLEPGGTSLTGSATFGQHPGLPLTLARA